VKADSKQAALFFSYANQAFLCFKRSLKLTRAVSTAQGNRTEVLYTPAGILIGLKIKKIKLCDLH